MDITKTIYEEDFIVSFKTKIGWFKAIRNKPVWYLYFGQDFLGKFHSIDRCIEYVEKA